MKTYRICYMLLAFVFLACSKSDDGQNNGGEEKSVDADYSVLLTNKGTLSNVMLNANLETITLDPNDGPFQDRAMADMVHRDGTVMSFYYIGTNCYGEIFKYNFKDNTSESIVAFADIGGCQLTVKAMAHSENNYYVAYELSGSGYFIRNIDSSGADQVFTDIALDHEPIQIAFSNDRVFVLTYEDDTEKYQITVLDVKSNQLIHEINLDFDVQKIARNMDGNVLVSYEFQHLEISSSTMAIVDNVRYNEGAEPFFGLSDDGYFDATGNLYYKRPSEDHSIYPTIPAIYDFANNIATIYIYELFLSEEQHKFEYKIGDTSMVSYDAKNNLLLIGYKKSDNLNKGGLLRILLSAQPKFMDNIDLDGVPYDIFVE